MNNIEVLYISDEEVKSISNRIYEKYKDSFKRLAKSDYNDNVYQEILSYGHFHKDDLCKNKF